MNPKHVAVALGLAAAGLLPKEVGAAGDKPDQGSTQTLTPSARQTQPTYQPRLDHPGRKLLPHPNVQPIYYLSCTAGKDNVLHDYIWTVTNEGRNTMPAGTSFEVEWGRTARYGSPVGGVFSLPAPLAPGHEASFTSRSTRFDRIDPTDPASDCMIWVPPRL